MSPTHRATPSSGTSKAQQTRARILTAALDLLNREGLEQVSTRQIAAAAGLSQGNLCYHFPAREQIIEALYHQLWQAFDDRLAVKAEDAASLPLHLSQHPLATYTLLEVQYRYRFLMLNFVQVMRTHPTIRSHFQAAVPRRQAQFAALFAHYIAQGWMHPEPFVGAHQRLVMQCYILGDFWMAEAEILFEGTPQECLLHYSQLLSGMFWPYLTPTGQALLTQAQEALPQQIKPLRG